MKDKIINFLITIAAIVFVILMITLLPIAVILIAAFIIIAILLNLLYIIISIPIYFILEGIKLLYRTIVIYSKPIYLRIKNLISTRKKE